MTVKKRLVLGAALGQCVHIAGLSHFLRLCEEEGFNTLNLGPAAQPAKLLDSISKHEPEIVAVSFRLTPEDILPLLEELNKGLEKLPSRPKMFFGGTPPVAELVRRSGIFDEVFDGSEEVEKIRAKISGKDRKQAQEIFPGTLLERIEYLYPYPLIRHHYGEPSLYATVEGAGKIADARVMDVLSIGPDQNAQEFFFNPSMMDRKQDGAGGVPLRKKEDLERIFQATRRGNYPLLRCYSGTNDLVRWADMLAATINIAWGAVPLCWYSALDGRSRKELREAIREKQEAMRHYADLEIPVEVNESHQWSLRDAHDSLAVATAYLSAYNAKKVGVKTFILQMMFNNPPSTAPHMDLAKMLAKLEMVTSLEDGTFKVLREVRAGIASLPSDPDLAKGHMSASAAYSMMLRPHILHVVGFSEGYKVVTPDVLIESCRIARGAINLALKGSFEPVRDGKIEKRKNDLVAGAMFILEAMKRLSNREKDPLSSPDVIACAIESGILDTPHFKGLPNLKGEVMTACVDGGWDAVCPSTGRAMGEEERIRRLDLEHHRRPTCAE